MEVSNTNNIEGKQVHVRATIALTKFGDIGEIIYRIKYNLSRQIVDKILEDKQFFWSGTEDIMGVKTFLNYGADCVLMTTEEVAALKKKSFTEGMQHASGFLPPRWDANE